MSASVPERKRWIGDFLRVETEDEEPTVEATHPAVEVTKPGIVRPKQGDGWDAITQSVKSV